MNKLCIILGNQLFPLAFYSDLKAQYFFMSEDRDLGKRYQFHQLKIAFFFIAMRRFRDQLQNHHLAIDYYELNEKNLGFFKNLEQTVLQRKISTIVIYEIEDKFFEAEILNFCKKNNLEIEIKSSPLFIVSRNRFKDYLENHKKPFMKTFYEDQRKYFKVLMKNDVPIGGKFSFDDENRKKLPANLEIPKPKWPEPEKIPYFDDVHVVIKNYFSEHPGNLKHFWFPTERSECQKWFQRFLHERFFNFGQYQDAITNKEEFLFHSAISSFLNVGLITPLEIIKVTEKFGLENNIPLNSIEGFIRQVLGWREFVRGIYQNFSDIQEQKNFWNHQNKLSPSWYEGRTGIDPLDDAIKRTLKYGHTHHIERLMVLSNIMLLCEIHPHEVHRWFMELFVDSSDWVMGPNVYGMGQFSDGGIFATKPYICGSNYILKMSDYKKGEWCDVLDALYWRFIHKNQLVFQKNPRMAMMAKVVQKMEQKKIAKYNELADNFIQKNTI